MPDPQSHVMDLIFGRWRSQTLYAGVQLGVFDALPGGTASSDDVAQRLSLDPTLTYRLMRGLSAIGLLEEREQRQFTLSEAGDLLRSDHPQTLRGVTLLEEGPQHYALWKHLPDMVRDGRQNAFVREFGRMAFEHTDHDPAYGDVFNQAMSSYSNAQSAWALDALEGVDFSSIHSVCDIGGGRGHLVCSLLARYPHLTGTVLELPTVVERSELHLAEAMGVADRCQYVAGDMFAEIPTADAYTMKMILHDWDDEECIRILSNIAGASEPGAHLFVIEHLIPEPGTPHFAKLFDIHMMCWGTGRERTAEEYAALMERSGWRFEGVRHPSDGLMAVVEAVRV